MPQLTKCSKTIQPKRFRQGRWPLEGHVDLLNNIVSQRKIKLVSHVHNNFQVLMRCLYYFENNYGLEKYVFSNSHLITILETQKAF